MGLFDQGQFDPQSYQGGNGIPGWLMQALQGGLLGKSAGFQPQEDPAALPPNARPTMGGPMMGNGLLPSIPSERDQEGMAGYSPMAPQIQPGGAPMQMPPMMGGPQPPDSQRPMQMPAPMGAPQVPQGVDGSSLPQQPLPAAMGGGSEGMGRGMASLLSLISGPSLNVSGALQTAMTGQRTDPQGMQQQALRATYESLRQSGVPDGVARAATLNPEILKTISPAYFDTAPKLQETGVDPITGKKSFSVYKPNAGTLTPVNGGAGSAAGGSSGMLAPGLTDADHTLTGDAYLNQFSPEVRAAVKAYMNGDVMPSGNPRATGINTVAKTIAQKYGQDMGIPVGDTQYAEKRAYRTQLGLNSATSAGGQAKSFVQGIEHMGELADTLKKLDNSNGFGIPGVAGVFNSIRQGVSTDQSAIADKASSIGQTLAGEVGKLFSGSAGGGVHERELTRERFSTVKSPPQLAAALEATLDMMQGGLTALENRRDQVLGPNSGVQFIPKATEDKIAHIRETIQQLKSGASKAADASAPGAPAVGEVRKGHSFLGGDPSKPESWKKQ